jgi:hypothetical protein
MDTAISDWDRSTLYRPDLLQVFYAPADLLLSALWNSSVVEARAMERLILWLFHDIGESPWIIAVVYIPG